MPAVSIYPAYSAGALVVTHVELPEVVPANKIKALAGHDKTASVFVTLPRHEREDKCKCFYCDTPKDRRFRYERSGWATRDPLKPFVRFDIGARNVRFTLRGGERFVVVAECDVDEWLAMLPLSWRGQERLALEVALPLTLERATKRKKEGAVDD